MDNQIFKDKRAAYTIFLVMVSFPYVELKLFNVAQGKVLNTKINLECPITIIGAGVSGSHMAYRLAPIYKDNICIFEQNKHVGGLTYDLNFNEQVPPAYSNESIVAQGATRFYHQQPAVKALADELNISYYRYDYKTSLIKARGRLYTSYNTMCAESYFNLTCAENADDFNAADHLWLKLLETYHKNKSHLYHYADFTAFCRDVLGDESTDYLRDSFRFRSDFENTNAQAYMEFLEQDWTLAGPIYYSAQGMSQFAKRMIARATGDHRVRLFLDQRVVRIHNARRNNGGFTFLIETSRYQIRAKQLIVAIPPIHWQNIGGSIAFRIKSKKQFQGILPVSTVTIQCYWPRRWWEESALFGPNIDRAWTRQNCISFIEIVSQQPQKKELNLTRTVYDDGLCVQSWSNLIARSSKADLIQEIRRGLQSIFIDVVVPEPTKIFTNVWPTAWHFQTADSRFTNTGITRWALRPLRQFHRQRLALIGEAFYPSRATWMDAAIKSSWLALTSQFGFGSRCYTGDSAAGGSFCTNTL